MSDQHQGEEREIRSVQEWYTSLQDLPYAAKLDLASALASLASADRKTLRDPYAHKHFGTSRDSAVQRLAKIQLRRMYALEGMSFREIALAIDVSYERVRQLYYRFYPEESNRGQTPQDLSPKREASGRSGGGATQKKPARRASTKQTTRKRPVNNSEGIASKGDEPDDSAKIRAHIESIQREDETWTDAVERFAASIYRDRSTVWRWLAGERRVPRSLWSNLPLKP